MTWGIPFALYVELCTTMVNQVAHLVWVPHVDLRLPSTCLNLHCAVYSQLFVYPPLLSSGHTVSTCGRSIYTHDVTCHILNNTLPVWHSQSEWYLSIWDLCLIAPRNMWFEAGTCPIRISPRLCIKLSLWATWHCGQLGQYHPCGCSGFLSHQWLKYWFWI